MDRRNIRARVGRQQRERFTTRWHQTPKQNQSSSAFVNFHFVFGDFVPVNSKKCEAGTRQRTFSASPMLRQNKILLARGSEGLEDPSQQAATPAPQRPSAEAA